MAHWSSVWNGFKEQRPPNSFQRNSGAFAVDPIGPSASVLSRRGGSVMISVICGGSPKFDAQVRPAFQKKLQQERSSTIINHHQTIKPSSHHQSEFVFLGYVYAFSKPCWCQDHFQVFEEMETSSEPREEAGGFLAEPRQGLGLVPFKLKFIYPVICIGTC